MSFKIASKFREAAIQINSIPVEKFPLLVNRVVQRLHLRNTRLFNIDEEDQLKSLFSLTSEQLKLILDGCCYIFEQVGLQREFTNGYIHYCCVMGIGIIGGLYFYCTGAFV